MLSFVLAVPLPPRLAALFALGAVLGGQVNWAIYTWAWNARPISPWALAPPKNKRSWFDCLPIVGWIALRREEPLHGRGFWIRPLLLELAVALGLPLLYLWEIQGGMLPQGGVAWAAENGAQALFHAQFVVHAVLLPLMLIATFIDFDEKTVPDEVTVGGVVLGLAFAIASPLTRLPIIDPPSTRALPQAGALELTSPLDWPAWLDGPNGLAIGLACYFGWCLALLPRFWYFRRGWLTACNYFCAGLFRGGLWRLVLGLALLGAAVIPCVWWQQSPAWRGLLSALVGMAFAGGLVWAVRVGAGWALGVEAMGFGDVTLMAMIGAFVGWQPALMIFFLAPFAALLIALAQLVLTRRQDIAFGPYLCLATLILLLSWRRLWNDWANDIFELGWFIPQVLAACLALMAACLAVWRVIKERLLFRGG